MNRALLATVVLLLCACGDDPPVSAEIPCEENRDCPARQLCSCAGFCYAPADCEESSECCVDEECQDGLCTVRSECGSDSECSGDRVCLQCVCLPRACSESADCLADEICEGGICFEIETAPCEGCAPGLVCDPVGGLCLPMPPHCGDFECQPGETVILTGIAERLGPTCDLRSDCACTEAREIPRGQFGTEFSALHVRSTEFMVLAHDRRYGDLVYYTFEGETEDAEVEYIDGVPDSPATGDPAGPRDGISDPGSEVGGSPSAAWLEGPASGELGVAYRNDTAQTLRFARRYADGRWEISTVDADGDTSSGASLISLGDRRWAVAYSSRSFSNSSLRLAISDNDAPYGPRDWQPIDLARGNAEPATMEDVPEATGLAPSMVRLGSNIYVAFYNGIEGNLELVHGPVYGPFEHVILDSGLPASGIEDAGDVGLYADLVVTPGGGLAVGYLDRISGEVLFGIIDLAGIDDEDTLGFTDAPEVVDPGRHAQPPLLVGPDLTIVYNAEEMPLVAYQDTSQGDLVVAFPSGDDWERTTVSRQGASGFSPHLFPNLGDSTWVLQGIIEDRGNGDLIERIDARPTPF